MSSSHAHSHHQNQGDDALLAERKHEWKVFTQYTLWGCIAVTAILLLMLLFFFGF
jgi:Bacterial aa3 type cytochrome c oxidase subunit IV